MGLPRFNGGAGGAGTADEAESAHALPGTGEIEHAAVTLGRSFDLAEHVASSRPGQRLNSVLRRLQPHATVGEVGELLARRPLNPVQVWS